MLNNLSLYKVGPSDKLELEFSPRLNLFTGDNGLGKTFLLDVIWWAHTNHWANLPAYGKKSFLDGSRDVSTISYSYSAEGQGKYCERGFTGLNSEHPWGETNNAIPSLCIYMKADGGCSITSPYKIMYSPNQIGNIIWPDVINLTSHEIWHGKNNHEKHLILGLLNDVGVWTDSKTSKGLNLFSSALEILSSDGEKLSLGNKVVKLPTFGAKPIPTLNIFGEDVPLLMASSAVKRILSFAYIIVWLWIEHTAITNTLPAERITIIFDEVEAHLHPKWQRLILPSILSVVKELSKEVETQLFISTHSPLVMASLESCFNQDKDSLFDLELENGKIVIKDDQFYKHGDANEWLTELFDLKQPYSKEAEQVIEAANLYMEDKVLAKGFESIEDLKQKLTKYLPSDDPIFPRWNAFLFGKQHD